MANPNMANVTAIYGKLAVNALTTSTANVITNAAASNTVVKLNTVSVSNYSNAAVYANVMVNRSSVVYYVAGNVSVPAQTTLVVLARDTTVYMEEGDVLQANVSANSAASIVSSYEIISS